MPLKLVKRPKSPYWIIRGTLRGVRVEESTGTSEKWAAEETRAKREAEILRESIYGRVATFDFAQASLSFLEEGGSRRFIGPVLDHFGTTPLRHIGQEAVDNAASKLYPQASNATRNRQVYTPVSAILQHAARKGWCPRPVFSRPKMSKVAMRWLKADEAERLIVQSPLATVGDFSPLYRSARRRSRLARLVECRPQTEACHLPQDEERRPARRPTTQPRRRRFGGPARQRGSSVSDSQWSALRAARA